MFRQKILTDKLSTKAQNNWWRCF